MSANKRNRSETPPASGGIKRARNFSPVDGHDQPVETFLDRLRAQKEEPHWQERWRGLALNQKLDTLNPVMQRSRRRRRYSLDGRSILVSKPRLRQQRPRRYDSYTSSPANPKGYARNTPPPTLGKRRRSARSLVPSSASPPSPKRVKRLIIPTGTVAAESTDTQPVSPPLPAYPGLGCSPPMLPPIPVFTQLVLPQAGSLVEAQHSSPSLLEELVPSQNSSDAPPTPPSAPSNTSCSPPTSLPIPVLTQSSLPQAGNLAETRHSPFPLLTEPVPLQNSSDAPPVPRSAHLDISCLSPMFLSSPITPHSVLPQAGNPAGAAVPVPSQNSIDVTSTPPSAPSNIAGSPLSSLPTPVVIPSTLPQAEPAEPVPPQNSSGVRSAPPSAPSNISGSPLTSLPTPVIIQSALPQAGNPAETRHSSPVLPAEPALSRDPSCGSPPNADDQQLTLSPTSTMTQSTPAPAGSLAETPRISLPLSAPPVEDASHISTCPPSVPSSTPGFPTDFPPGSSTTRPALEEVMILDDTPQVSLLTPLRMALACTQDAGAIGVDPFPNIPTTASPSPSSSEVGADADMENLVSSEKSGPCISDDQLMGDVRLLQAAGGEAMDDITLSLPTPPPSTCSAPRVVVDVGHREFSAQDATPIDIDPFPDVSTGAISSSSSSEVDADEKMENLVSSEERGPCIGNDQLMGDVRLLQAAGGEAMDDITPPLPTPPPSTSSAPRIVVNMDRGATLPLANQSTCKPTITPVNITSKFTPSALAYPATGVAGIAAVSLPGPVQLSAPEPQITSSHAVSLATPPSRPSSTRTFDTVGHTAIPLSSAHRYSAHRKTFDTAQTLEVIGLNPPRATSRQYDTVLRSKPIRGGGTSSHILRHPRVYDNQVDTSSSLQRGRRQAPSIRTYETKQLNGGIHRTMQVDDDVTMGDVGLKRSPDHSGEDGMIYL